jgi:hypothetical protein
MWCQAFAENELEPILQSLNEQWNDVLSLDDEQSSKAYQAFCKGRERKKREKKKRKKERN